jgi:hypothetical protein
MARMALAGVVPDAFSQFIETPGFGPPLPEQHPMDILRREAAHTADGHSVAIYFPFQDGARANAELSTDVRGY